MLLFSSPCYNYSLFYVSGECLRGYTTNKNFGYHFLLLRFNFTRTCMPMKKKPQEYFIMKAMKFCYISPPPQKKSLTTRPFLKIKVLKVLKDGGVKSWVGLSRCYCCLISLGMVKQQNEIKRQMFIEHIARFDKRGRTFK